MTERIAALPRIRVLLRVLCVSVVILALGVLRSILT